MCVREDRALQQVKAIAVFLAENGRYPSRHAKAPLERSLGRCLRGFKRAYKGGCNYKERILYPSIIPFAESIGMPSDWLKAYSGLPYLRPFREKRARLILVEVAKFYTKYGRYPARLALDVVEADLGTWLQSVRYLFKSGDGRFYDSLIPLGAELGLPSNWHVSKSYKKSV